MRFIFFITVALCFSACFAQRYLKIEILGGYEKINLQNPPTDFLSALEYVEKFHDGCKIDKVTIDNVYKAQVQGVAGKKYKIDFKSNQTVEVSQSLPDQNDKVSYEITSCN